MTRFAAAARCLVVSSLVLLAGCGAGIYPSSLDPKPPVPAPHITFSPGSLNFTTVLGQPSASQSILVTNTGDATLNLASITLLDTTDYAITSNNCVSTLAPSTSCTVSISFTPQAVASYPSSVKFVDNSDNIANSVQNIPLNGACTAVPVPIAQLLPATLTFPDTPTATSATSQTLTLKNIGGASLLISSFLVTGSSYALDTVSSTCSTVSSLAPSASCTYVITFTPTAIGPQTGSFTVTDNDHNLPGSTQTSTFTGNGTAPAPIITITPTSLDFGSTTAVGSASASQTVTLGNIGNATLNLASVALNSHDDYILTNNCSATIAPAATCTLVVTFTPTNPGAIPSSITLTDNDHNIANSTQTISLTGSGATPPAPIAQLTPVTSSFPDTAQGTTSTTTQTITLKNIGTAALTVSGISYTGTSFGESSTCLVGSVLPVNNTCAFTVSFTPTTNGALSGSVTVTDDSNGVPGSTQTATFTGNGTPGTGTLTLTPDPGFFPDTFAGSTSAVVPFTLHNGGATVSGLTIAFGGGSSSSAFAQTNTCGTSLAGGSSCTINATFTPAVAGTYQSLLTVNYTGATSALTDLVTGNGLASCTTGFTPSPVTFNTTTINTAASPQTSTFTNCSSSALAVSNISFTQAGGGTAFTQANNCGSTLASAASCTFTFNFTPTAAITYTGTVTVTDSATNSPQTLTVTGSGTTSTISYQLLEFGFPHTPGGTSPSTANIPALYALINNAKTSIDMVMYAMQDTTFTNDLVAACGRGVKVRAILDQNSEKSRDTPTYTALNNLTATTGCSAVWANKAFSVTHEKSLVIDGTTIALMSLNLESQYYSTTRDWAMIYNDPADVAAMQGTFNADFAAGTPASGVAGASDKTSYTPSAGSGDLIWSPQTSLPAMLSIINNATTTLVVSNEELGTSTTSTIVAAMVDACKNRHVIASILIENDSSYAGNFAALKAAGCGIHTYNGTGASDPYIHAKAVVADYGLPTQNAYMGSINYSSASMTQNRELGMFISDQASVTLLYNSIMADYNDSRATIH